MAKTFFVYIMASRRNGTLYIGVTSDLVARTYTHRENIVAGFTRQYGVHRLVWFEWIDDAEAAIRREKQLKKWNRDWKLRLIEETNPRWDDLYPSLFRPRPPNNPPASFPRRRESSAANTGVCGSGYPPQRG